MKAWHFTSDKLRDDRPLPAIGEKLVHDGKLVMCESGLHASKRIIDALRYAPGHMIHRVEVGGEIIHHDDKLACSERTILWSVDGEELLRKFARMCALDVIHLWDAPEVVVRYLKTGDESVRDAAWDAARDAAGAAAWAVGAAAWAAAWDAAWAAWAVGAAAWDAAWDAAWAAGAAGAAGEKQNQRLCRMVMAAKRGVEDG